MTRSINESENENVVTKAIEYANRIHQRKFPYRVVPPVLRFSGNEIENNIGIVGKYVKFQPTERNSGCFVAVITREVCLGYFSSSVYLSQYSVSLNFMNDTKLEIMTYTNYGLSFAALIV